MRRFIGDGRSWYSKEIRVIRNNKHIRSYRDAQGFRFDNGRKLRVKWIDAYIYHYGWVRSPVIMFRKQHNFEKHWGPGKEMDQAEQGMEIKEPEFNYSKIDSVTLFEETHPSVMMELVSKEDRKFTRI